MLVYNNSIQTKEHMTHPTLAEFEKTNEARKLIAQNVLVWVNDLCNALKNDYIHTSVESYKRKLHSASSEWDVQYLSLIHI